MGNLAIVDLGSNSARLSSQALTDKCYHEIYREKRDTRLAAGMGQTGHLQPAAMTRTITALKDFCQLAAQYQPTKTLAITTAAVRLAVNQAEFLRQVTLETGLELRVLSGHDEAYYDYLGVRATLPKVTDGMIIDIGGGSVEIIRFTEKSLIADVSLPLGAVTVMEQFQLGANHVLTGLPAAQKQIIDAFEQLTWLPQTTSQPLILLGGANRSLLAVAKQGDVGIYDSQFHGYHLSAHHVIELFDDLCRKSIHERQQLAAAEPQRADIMVSGLLPLVTLLKLTGAPTVIFSESGVRDGLLQEQLGKK